MQIETVKRAGVYVAEKASIAGAVVLGTVASAHAALPASVDTSVTAAIADAQSAFDKTFPLLVAVAGLMIIRTLFKRFFKA